MFIISYERNDRTINTENEIEKISNDEDRETRKDHRKQTEERE